MHRLTIVACALFITDLIAGPAVAGEPSSTYTKLDLGACRIVAQSRETGSIAWSCPGYDGIEIWAAADDLRYFVSFSSHAGDLQADATQAGRQIAARQTLPPFNSLNDTVEWRLAANGRPFATILRWFTSFDDGREGEILVVTKIAPDGVCHIAYVDARANPNANELARQAADTLSAGFDCTGGTPVIVGNPGTGLRQ